MPRGIAAGTCNLSESITGAGAAVLCGCAVTAGGTLGEPNGILMTIDLAAGNATPLSSGTRTSSATAMASIAKETAVNQPRRAWPVFETKDSENMHLSCSPHRACASGWGSETQAICFLKLT